MMRRKFLATTSAAAAGLTVFAGRSYLSARSPNARILLGVIGYGNMAQALWKYLVHIPEVEVIAAADAQANAMWRVSIARRGNCR